MKENTKTVGKKDDSSNSKKTYIALAAIFVIAIIIVIILFILFKKDVQYNITFDSNGGSSIQPIIVNEDGLINEPKDPKREGYIFGGWYYDDELWDFSKEVTEDIILEAKWISESISVSGVKFGKNSLTLAVGETDKLTAIIMPDNATNKSLLWSSSDSNVVSVGKDGTIKALKEGSATITVKTKDGDHTAKITIKVEKQKEIVKVEGISLNKTSLSLDINETAILTAKIKPSDATNKKVTWKSSNKNVVTVDANGKVTAKSEGTATITVTTKDGGFSAKCVVTVSKKVVADTTEKDTSVAVTGVTLNKSNVSLYVGGTDTLVATINPSNATNKGITWSSSNNSVATVDANGKVIAKSEGTAVITVTTSNGKKAECTITVNDKYDVVISERKIDFSATIQYVAEVSKNGKTISDWKVIKYSGDNVLIKGVNGSLSSEALNTNITKVKIVLADDSEVTANVKYS